MLFQIDESFDNYRQVYEDYKNALEIRSDRVKKLYDEIKIIKKLEVWFFYKRGRSNFVNFYKITPSLLASIFAK